MSNGLKKSSGYIKLLRIPAFSLFLSGRIVSELGDILFTMATMWYVLTTTDSALATAIVPLVPGLTFIILSMPLSTLTDRLPKKWVLIGTDILRAVVVLSVFLLMMFHQINPLTIYLANLLLTIFGIMFSTAEQAALPKILPNSAHQLAEANGLLSAINRSVTLFGYGIGGVIVAWLGSDKAILIDGISFFLSALSLSMISIPALRAKASRGFRGFLRDSSQGLRFIWRKRSLRILILFGASVNMFGAPLQIFTAVFSSDVLHAGTTGYGYLEAAAAAGGLIGALVSGKLAHTLRLGQWMALSFLVGGATLVLMALFPSLFLSIVLFGISMAASALLNIPLITTLQLLAPDNMRGRVMASFGLLFSSVVPIGLILGGWLTTILGPILLFSIVGLINIISGVTVCFMKTFSEDTELNRDKVS